LCRDDAKPPARDLDDEELDDLPPIDGGDAEDGEPPPEELDEEEAGREGGAGDPLDDSTGEDDPVDDEELDTAGAEGGWMDDAGESETLDVGVPDTFGEEEGSALLEGADELEAEEEDDLGFGEEPSAVGDAGEEGFVDDDEDLREEDLPRLDAEDESDLDDADLAFSLPDDDEIEESRPPWDDRAWERAEGEVRVPPAAAAPACGGAVVTAFGEGLARVEPDGQVTRLEGLGLRGGAPTAIASQEDGGGGLLVTTPRGGVLVSSDGGRSFVEANGWRACVASEVGPGGRDVDGPLEIAARGAEIWGRTRSGALVASRDRGATWERVAAGKRFEAIALDAATGDLFAVARDAGATHVLQVAQGAVLGGAFVAEDWAALPSGPVIDLAAHAGELAIGVLGRGAFRGASGASRAWARLEGTASITALTFGSFGAILVALYSDGDGKSWIVEGKPEVPPSVVAELEAPADDDEGARVKALRWDDRRKVLWAAGGFGLAAVRPVRH
jgi:hypothetical protein